MSRFYLVDYPTMSPGQCKICGSATKTPMVDMQCIEEFYGSVYYCFECAGEIAGMLSFASPAEVKKLNEIKHN